MFDALLDFISTFLLFEVGRQFLRLVTGGRYYPQRDRCNVYVISTIGFFVIAAIGTGFFIIYSKF